MAMYGPDSRHKQVTSTGKIRRHATILIGISEGRTSLREHIHKQRGKGKGKVVPVLLLTEHHAMKAYWGSGV
jgi:hypothetical protein